MFISNSSTKLVTFKYIYLWLVILLNYFLYSMRYFQLNQKVKRLKKWMDHAQNKLQFKWSINQSKDNTMLLQKKEMLYDLCVYLKPSRNLNASTHKKIVLRLLYLWINTSFFIEKIVNSVITIKLMGKNRVKILSKLDWESSDHKLITNFVGWLICMFSLKYIQM